MVCGIGSDGPRPGAGAAPPLHMSRRFVPGARTIRDGVGGRLLLEFALLGKLIQRESGKSVCKVCRGMAITLLIWPCEGTVRGYL
jgi:hypothetical protein